MSQVHNYTLITDSNLLELANFYHRGGS